jgi:hypothetical protein
MFKYITGFDPFWLIVVGVGMVLVGKGLLTWPVFWFVLLSKCEIKVQRR